MRRRWPASGLGAGSLLAVLEGGRRRSRLVSDPAARRTWWVTFALMGALFGLWSLASPVWSVPDEAAHVVNAAAVVRGQAGGQDRVVEVPKYYAHTDGRYPPCYAFHPERTAACLADVPSPEGVADAVTQFDRYPPLPYALLGLPSLLPPSGFAVHVMRLVDVVVCAALVASGLSSAMSLGRKMTVAATLFAVTPMAAYLAGSVNPNSIEIVAAIALWLSLLLLARDGPGAPGRLIVRTSVAACLLASARPLSPMWLALILALAGLAVGWTRVRALAGDPRVVRAAVAVAAVVVLCVAWVGLRHSLSGIVGVGEVSHGFTSDIVVSVGKFPGLFREMIGTVGWLDTPPPFVLVALWAAVLGGLILLAVLTGERWGVLALLATAILVFVIPVALEVARAKSSGFPWQGRYTLPLAVGVPILAGWLVDTGKLSYQEPVRWAARVVVVVACGAQLVVHAWSTRRYVTGTRGSVLYFVDPVWDPPVPAWLLLVAFAAVAVALGAWTDRLVAGGVRGGRVGRNAPARSPGTTRSR